MLFRNFKKRTRSASTASDRQSAIAISAEPPPSEKPATQTTKPATARNKRGSRKANTTDVTANETEEGPYLVDATLFI